MTEGYRPGDILLFDFSGRRGKTEHAGILERVETDLAKKMFDFMSGATYALSGNVQRVTANIFIFAPANVDIAAKMNNRETAAQPASGNYPSQETKSPWR